MTTLLQSAPPPKSLTRVLGQSEQAQGLVSEAAEKLSTANEDLKQELEERAPAPGVESALEMSEAAEGKVREASEKLSFGIAVFPRDGGTSEALIRSADAAMYAAKHSKAGYAFARAGNNRRSS